MRIFLITVLVILFYGLVAGLLNQPHHIPDKIADGKLLSLSFAPFRQGQSPLEAIFPSPEELEQDVSLLADKTHSIRTYASAHSMQPISRLAEKYGLQMIQGAWLEYSKTDNETEIAALIESANNYPDVVKRVIVGNEVLLRGEMEPETLIKYIRKVKKAIKQPVSYADVWSMYMKYPQIMKEVDFITIHILPYWEDEPVAVETAPQHIEQIYKKVRRKAELIVPGIPILIGETGWPSQGRQRGLAIPGIVNEASFIRGLIAIAQENGFDYNIIEAFNQPWKAKLEGTVGANWGLYTANRTQVFPLTGPVYENPDWYLEWLLASLIVLVTATLFRKKIGELDIYRSALLIIFLQLITTLLLSMAHTFWANDFSFWQHLNTAFIVTLNILISSLLLRKAFHTLKGTNTCDTPGMLLYLLYLGVILIVIYKTYRLAVYGRYLNFPVEMLYIPVTGIIGLIIFRCIAERQLSLHTLNLNPLLGNKNRHWLTDKLPGFSLLFMGIALIYGETRAFMLGRDFITAYPDFNDRLMTALLYTLSNNQLINWLLCLTALAIPLLISGRDRTS